MIGLVNLENDRAWLFRRQEFEGRAQHHPEDRLHLYFYVDPSYHAGEDCHERDFEPFKIEHRITELFGIPERPAIDPFVMNPLPGISTEPQ